jgi:predicted dehydrogenase
MRQTLRAALIGFGYWGPNLLRNLVFHGGYDVVGVAELNGELRTKCSKTYPHIPTFATVEEMLAKAKPEAVVIATPPNTHHDLAIRSMKAGAHVLIEKPMALSVAECDSVLQTARRLGRKVMVDHTFVHHPAVRYLKEQVVSQSLGHLMYYDSVRVALGGFQRSADVLWDLAPHDLSILDYLLNGEQPVSVAVMGARHYDPSRMNLCYLHLNYQHEFVAHLHLNWTAPVKVRTVMLAGDKKMAIFDENMGSEKIRVYDRGLVVENLRANYRSGDMVAPAISSQEALSTVLSDFHAYLATDQKPISDGEFGRRIVNVMEAAVTSMKSEGAPVTLATDETTFEKKKVA